MKLTIWYAECLDDHVAYSIREQSKKAAVARLEAAGNNRWRRYGPLVRLTLEYTSGFDLLEGILGESGLWGKVIDEKPASGPHGRPPTI